ncbi:replication protein [Bacillus sp. FJAT-26390]|uniref:replication protein n=1 Tax=Bacillus sp. FJAT-26390 TaxID=1743142 RepID=UPI000807D7F4|nr:replication protein [Bacillus sp. FJAT-26390]OBZ13313.1 hypothetical protein A7975_10670 [Bacillus sp. FJAT-26390]
MAKPQKENGYTVIAHEILDNICRFNFNGAQLRIIMKVWRMTYGYKRKDHALALTYLQEATGLSRGTMKKELGYLIEAKVLIVTKEATNKDARKLAFNKNYDEWEGVAMAAKGNFEGSDSDPQQLSFEGSDSDPLEGCNTDPLDLTLRGAIVTPNKDIKSLKIIFKDNTPAFDYFDYFYSVYPRRISKQAALKAWTKLSREKSFDPERIISNTVNYAETCKLLDTKVNFIPHPSTYLNQKRYVDYWEVDPEGLAAGKATKFDDNMEFFREQFGGGERLGQAADNLAIDEGGSGLPE